MTERTLTVPYLCGVIEPFPTGVIAWIAVGVACALFSGLGLKGNKLGLIGDLFFGVMGSLIASAPIGFFFRNTEGFFGSILVAFVGAIVCIVLSRALFGHRTA